MTNNKQQTAVEWFIEQLNSKYGGNDFIITHINEIEKAKQMQKEQSQAYAAFCVGCDRKKLPLLEFEGWIKLEGGNK
jgi:hypothetical protein